jgi:hypothetical protein
LNLVAKTLPGMDLPVRLQLLAAALAVGCSFALPMQAQVITPTPGSAPEVKEEMINGVRYQVTRQVVQQQMPVTVMRDQTQTVLTQQVTTETIPHQQVYTVPVTQYEMVATLHGRWNPFVEPYYTYEMQPVTYYQEQVASVQIPMSKVTWVPQTKTVQVPVTEYKMGEREVITRVALTGGESNKTYAAQPSANQTVTNQPVNMQPYNSQPYTPPASSIASQPATGYPTSAMPLPTNSSAQPTYGYGQPAYNSTPAASIAARQGNQSAIGGQQLQSDPPRQGTGWSNLPNNGSGYR